MATNTNTLTHAVVRTRFHGGGIVSRHRTAEAAERARARYAKGCSCGCAHVIPMQEVEGLRASYEDGSPYAAAR